MATVRAARGGQVAIYDALLFLMVIILVSVGMFLYSAKLTSEGAGFDGRTYTHLARDQLDATLGLGVNVTGLYVNVTGGPSPGPVLLEDSGVLYRGPWTVDKVLHGCVELAKSAKKENATRDLSGIGPRVDRLFAYTNFNTTHCAWALELDGRVVMFFSDSGKVTDPGDLPPVRYAASTDLSMEGMPATLTYYLWLA
jgi:hypothetical protein